MTAILTPEQEAEIRRIVREELAATAPIITELREHDPATDGPILPPIDPRVQQPPRRTSDGL